MHATKAINAKTNFIRAGRNAGDLKRTVRRSENARSRTAASQRDQIKFQLSGERAIRVNRSDDGRARTSGVSKKPSSLKYGYRFTKVILQTWLR